MSDECEHEHKHNLMKVEMSRENLAHAARLMAESLTLFADRIDGLKLLAWHEVLSEAASVFSDVGVIVDANGPEILRAWLCEQRRIAAIATQN